MEPAQLKEALAENIVHREAECDQYQMNIDNYEIMIAALPSEWPTELNQYKNMNPEQLVDAIESDADLDTVVDLQLCDKLKRSVRLEKIQQRVAKCTCDALIERHDAIELSSSSSE
jgi:hypothetical protein